MPLVCNGKEGSRYSSLKRSVWGLGRRPLVCNGKEGARWSSLKNSVWGLGGMPLVYYGKYGSEFPSIRKRITCFLLYIYISTNFIKKIKFL